MMLPELSLPLDGVEILAKYTKTQARRAVQSIMDKGVKLVQSGYASMRDIIELEKIIKKFERNLK
jgi:hypothetical protein